MALDVPGRQIGHKIGTGCQRVSRYETGQITPSLDGISRFAEALNLSIDHLPIDDVPRPLHAAERNLGDRRTLLLDVLDAFAAKNCLNSLAGGIS